MTRANEHNAPLLSGRVLPSCDLDRKPAHSRGANRPKTRPLKRGSPSSKRPHLRGARLEARLKNHLDLDAFGIQGAQLDAGAAASARGFGNRKKLGAAKAKDEPEEQRKNATRDYQRLK